LKVLGVSRTTLAREHGGYDLDDEREQDAEDRVLDERAGLVGAAPVAAPVTADDPADPADDDEDPDEIEDNDETPATTPAQEAA
jgi:hypothetical protein